MTWRSVSLTLSSHCAAQSFAEFSIDFTHSALSFNGFSPTSGLDFAPVDFTATESDFLTALHSSFGGLELLLGIHVDYSTEAGRLAWALNREGGPGTPLEGLESAVVLLIVDGVEVLSRNTGLWKLIKDYIGISESLQPLETRCNEMNLTEKNRIRAHKSISTSALLYMDSQSESKLTTWVLVKPRPQGRLHSDLWLLAGFAQFLHPEAVGFLEAELVPRPRVFDTMLRRLRDDSTLAGVLGAPEVVRTEDTFFMNLLKQADGFETLYSQILYGPIENLGGYVSQPLVRFVLYNWKQLRDFCPGALMDYFKPFTTAHSLSWLDNNLYEFVPGLFLHLKARLDQQEPARFMFKRDVKADWYLPNKLVRWISYRARVVNANLLSYLAVMKSTPRCSRRCVGLLWVFIEFYFFHVAFLVKWFSIGAYYVLSSMSVRVIIGKVDENANIGGVYRGWKYSYLLVLAVLFFMALGRQRERGKWLWAAIIGLNVAQSLFNFAAMLYNVIHQNGSDASTLVIVGISVIVAVAVSFLLGYWMWKGCFKCFKSGCARELGHYLYGGLLYLVLFPIYTNVLGIYAVCNTSEDCWGLAVTTSSQNRTMVQSVLSVRKNIFLVLFIVLNLIFGVLWEQLDINGESGNSRAKKAFLYLYYVGMLVLVLPVCGLQFIFRACKKKTRTGQEEERNQLKSRADYPDSPQILTY